MSKYFIYFLLLLFILLVLTTNYLMAIELNNEDVEKICKQNNYFHCELIKEKIIGKAFTIVEKDLMCPITIDLCHTCYTIKKCGHEFSKEILKVDKCPLCRTVIRGISDV